MEYTPSKYQKDIFDFVSRGSGNLVIEAAAGSGKTWTLCKCIGMLPEDARILVAAFNADIVKELRTKLSDCTNTDISTIHSIGLKIISKHYGEEFELGIFEYKYLQYIKDNLFKLTDESNLPKSKVPKFIKNTLEFVNLGRLFLATSKFDMEQVMNRYGIECFSNEMEAALRVMEWGQDNLDQIDFTDMIWIPNVKYLSPRTKMYDYIFVDEAQDLSKAQRELLLKFRKINTRIIAAGCDEQTIYSFNGADPESFNEFKSLPNTITLPLSISYRCADRIVEFASSYGKIEKNENNIPGTIEHFSSLHNVDEGSMVICRNNAPLMYAYGRLMVDGKKCKFLGKNIEAELVSYIENNGNIRLNTSLLADGFFSRMYDYMFDVVYKIMHDFGVSKSDALSTSSVQHLYDVIQTLEVLSYGLSTTDELKERIIEVFSTSEEADDESTIRLSTIHKAKGLEANSVYIVCNSLMPSPYAKKAWEIKQERCLMYVAYTRAKNKLSFVDEYPFKDFVGGEPQIRLASIETKINALYNRDRKFYVDEKNSKKVIDTARPIQESGRSITTSVTEILNKNKDDNGLSSFKNRRKHGKK